MTKKPSNKDISWGYFAQFFSIASGVVVLPLILRMLSPEEIGMNYLMLTVGTMVSLFDFGFAPQFGRNITYIFSGVQILKKEGIEINQEEKEVNYRLLATMIHTAKSVYSILSIVVLVVMLTCGSLYIYKVTNGFTNVHNALIIWIIYSISTFINIYYTYYSSLLTGKGLIKEARKAMVYSKILYIILMIIFLISGFGLLGVALANLIAPFANRYISYQYFFTKDFKEKINSFEITKQEKKDLFEIIWYNSKKLGLVYIGSYAISRFSMFLAGLYLPLKTVASYGLMLQLVGIIFTISGELFIIYNPRFSALRVQKNYTLLLKDFSFSMGVYYTLFIIGSICLAFLGPWFLTLVKSHAALPAVSIILLYTLVMLLEGNHSYFASMIVMGNRVPFMWLALITGGLIALGSYFSLAFTNLGILGLILVQGIVQVAYNNWKWPLVICKEFNINFIKFLYLSFSETFKAINNGKSKYKFFSNR